MAQIFCTLKQAADQLETTEAEIETLIHDGILREFHDGFDRLLKVADLTGSAVAASAAGGRQPALAQREGRLPQPGLYDAPAETADPEIKLPSAAAVTMEVKPPRAVAPRRSPRPDRQPASQKRSFHPVVQKPAVPRRRQGPPRAVAICPEFPTQRPRPQTCEMSLRQWIWTGLIDDNPLAIVILFGTVVLAISGVAGVIYLLARFA